MRILPAPPLSLVLTSLLCAALLATATGCGDEASQAAQGTSEAAAHASSLDKQKDTRARPDRGRPLPAFAGTTLDGEHIASSDLIGKRLLLFFFNPEVPEAGPSAEAIRRIAGFQTSHNFALIGVAIGSEHDTARDFAAAQQLDFPIVDDSSGRITQALRLRATVLTLGSDADGYMSFALYGARDATAKATDAFEEQLRSRLRLPPRQPTSGRADLLSRTLAPDFEAERIEGGRFSLAETSGQPLVLIFFLHSCPHCHHALKSLQASLAKLPADKRPRLLGVSISGSSSTVKRSLRDAGLETFEIVRDLGGSAQASYGVFGGVPVVLLIDARGQIRHRVQGWHDRDAAIVRMWMARIAGADVPMLLNPKGFTGNDACSVCHQRERATWELTQHATAFDTLVTHSESHNGECVSCHVVGFDQPGGFSLAAPRAHLENVGCESCHGQGGPHISPDSGDEASASDDYEASCAACHDPKHSLGFDFDTFLPRISHEAIAALSPEQRSALAAKHGGVRDVLPTGADYVGSQACKSCHESEFATWQQSPHARAVHSLTLKNEGENADCLRCHTTGYGREGGFPAGALPASQPALAEVGCESCHGPGGDHVAPDATRRGNIVSLGDKCDSCVILQICGSCHDSANDPSFEFEVEQRIEQQRHGTIEAGTGKPLASPPSRS